MQFFAAIRFNTFDSFCLASTKMKKNLAQGTKDSLLPIAPPNGLPLWKRSLDLGCVLLAAPLLFPLMFLVAVIIKVVSPGPALFKQERIGFRGRKFTIFKFRTM